ncbi:translesion error-prone DNA polymerase V autoproteolytic subunit [Stenotrophomonas sp. PS02301]|uniref:LexA family protein n=1 Tax=Stenotrophomonas sp. PS02301 TaxID=2991427 RepID=UPI00249C660F|nr:translesion error-prone DNA polymerase V autoproteolytic subunit [Stenotrophomonas sp. PS02301]
MAASTYTKAHPQPAEACAPVLPVNVTCGFPSPAEDFYGDGDGLDLNRHCISNPVATFFAHADTGTSMVGFGIHPGDTLVVDRSRTARHGDIVLVNWEGGFTVKKLVQRRGQFELHSSAEDIPPIIVPPDIELDVWGVVTWSFTRHT